MNYKKALKDLSDNIHFEWFVMGSANLALQGVNIRPLHLSILIHHRNLQNFLSVYKSTLRTKIRLLENREAEEFVMTIHETEILVRAEYDHSVYCRVNNGFQMKKIDRMTIPCFSLLAEREACKSLNATNKVALIDDFLGIFLETKRVCLKHISDCDFQPLSQLFAEPEAMKSPLRCFLKGPFSFERSKKILQMMMDNKKKYGFGACSVIHKETSQWMGFCALWREEKTLKTDFSYRFFPQFWGQGYATESARACLGYILEKSGDIVINSYIEATNKASIRVAEKIGMEFIKNTTCHNLPVCLYSVENKRNHIFSRIANWGNSNDVVRAIIMIGSRAQEKDCDEFSDYDFSIFTTDFTSFIKDNSWISSIGAPWTILPEKIYRDGEEFPTRLVIFEGGVKIDFSFFPMKILDKLIEGRILPVDYNIGYRVLLDKDDLTRKMPEPTPTDFLEEKPSEDEFKALVEEFWFEAYHVAKYLARGDLWSLKFRDHGIKDNLLVKMIGWNAQAKQNWRFSPNPNGKQMQSWLAEDIWNSLSVCFADFDLKSSEIAFEKTIDLFRKLALETAKILKYRYPEEVDRNISGFILQRI